MRTVSDLFINCNDPTNFICELHEFSFISDASIDISILVSYFCILHVFSSFPPIRRYKGGKFYSQPA